MTYEILLIVPVVFISGIIYMLRTASAGYEDELGFHYNDEALTEPETGTGE
jgi:hypothetical protein